MGERPFMSEITAQMSEAALDNAQETGRKRSDVEADGRIGLAFFGVIICYCTVLFGASAALAAFF